MAYYTSFFTWASVTSEAFRPSLSPRQGQSITKTAATAKLSQKLPIPHVELQQVAVLDPLSLCIDWLRIEIDKKSMQTHGEGRLSLFLCVCVYICDDGDTANESPFKHLTPFIVSHITCRMG